MLKIQTLSQHNLNKSKLLNNYMWGLNYIGMIYIILKLIIIHCTSKGVRGKKRNPYIDRVV